MRIFAGLVGLGGCSAIERIHVQVEPGEVPVISWDGGMVHEVFVVACESDCNDACSGPGYVKFSGPVVWSVGYDSSIPEDAVTSDPALQSPLSYGQSEVPGDERLLPAEPLKDGAVYGVQVKRLVPCGGLQAGCSQVESVGCARF